MTTTKPTGGSVTPSRPATDEVPADRSAFAPEAFGKYYLIDRIATGGMAEIFKAKTFSHGGFEHLLVIKRILSHLGDNEEFVEMFIDEAKVSVALQHANIIRIYDFGKILQNYFIAMEWVDGKDSRNILKKLSRQRKFLPFEYAAYIAHEACKGLEYAHRKTDLQGRPYGIVHRDVSPSNILVSYEGDVKVADFGIAKAESNAYNTKDGVLKGKFEYMSPEQAEGIEIDHRSDIFSLGIILHEMLTGRRLFKTGSDTATLEKIKSGDYPLPSSLHPKVPPELERIVMKALTRNRDERYQSAKEMQEDLLAFLMPATPDQVRGSLAKFMSEVFAEEIADERKRLAEGSEIAERLRKLTPAMDGWEGHTNSTMTPATANPEPKRGMVPLLAIGGIGVLLVVVVGVAAIGGVGLGAAAYTNSTPPPTVAAPVEAAKKPTTGDLDIVVLPAGRISVDGKVVAEKADTYTAEKLAPGEHRVRVEAEGYEPLEEAVTVAAGEVVRFKKTLKALPAPVAAATPTTKRDEKPERTAATVAAPPQEEKAAPGKLSVVLLGGAASWANVYVDGVKLPKTAPFSNVPIEPGTHKIRVENAAAGIDHTETVKVGNGAAIKVSASPQ